MNNPNEISEIQTNFYQTMYSEKINQNNLSYEENLNNFLINNKMPKLSDEERELCEKTVCHNEILKACPIVELQVQMVCLQTGINSFGLTLKIFLWIVSLIHYQMGTYQSNRGKASSLCCQRKAKIDYT